MFLVQIDHDDLAALLSKAFTCGTADPGAAIGDEADLVLKSHGHGDLSAGHEARHTYIAL